jgi:hypothetical protein
LKICRNGKPWLKLALLIKIDLLESHHLMQSSTQLLAEFSNNSPS